MKTRLPVALLTVLLLAGATVPARAADSASNLSMPWSNSQTWAMTGGPHNWNAGIDDGHPWSSLDFCVTSNGLCVWNSHVYAARGGIAHTNDCGSNPGLVRIDHGD